MNKIFNAETWIGTYAILIKIYSTNGNIIVQLKTKLEAHAPHLSHEKQFLAVNKL